MRLRDDCPEFVYLLFYRAFMVLCSCKLVIFRPNIFKYHLKSVVKAKADKKVGRKLNYLFLFQLKNNSGMILAPARHQIWTYMTEREAKNKPNKGNLADMEMDQRREWSFVFGCEGGRDEEKYSPEHPGDL